MTEQMHYATYGRSRHRRRPDGHLRPRRRGEERAIRGGRDRDQKEAADPPPNEDSDSGNEAAMNRSRATSAATAPSLAAAATAGGPEGCYYIPKRVRICGMESPSREATSKSPMSCRSSSGGRGEDPPTHSKSPLRGDAQRRRRTKWDASTPSLTNKGISPPPTRGRRRSSPAPPPRAKPAPSPSPAASPSPRSSSCDVRPRVKLSRSQSWDGRTKHYDRNKLKSSRKSDAGHGSDGGYASAGGDTVASRLSKQLAAFDLNSQRNVTPIGRRRRSLSIGRRKNKTNPARNKKEGKEKKSSFNIKVKKDEAKSFLKEKVIPLMPVMNTNSCKKRSSRKQLESSDANFSSSSVKKGRGLGEDGSARKSDGSATYNSSSYDSDDDDSYYSCEESYYSDEEDSFYSHDESDGSDVDASSYYSSEEEKREPEGRRRSDHSSGEDKDKEDPEGRRRSYYSSNEDQEEPERRRRSYFSSDAEKDEPEGRRRSSRSSFLNACHDYHDKNKCERNEESRKITLPPKNRSCFYEEESGNEEYFSGSDSDRSFTSNDDEESFASEEDEECSKDGSYASHSSSSSRSRNGSIHSDRGGHGSMSDSSMNNEEVFCDEDSHASCSTGKSMNSNGRKSEEVGVTDSHTSRSTHNRMTIKSLGCRLKSRISNMRKDAEENDADYHTSQSSTCIGRSRPDRRIVIGKKDEEGSDAESRTSHSTTHSRRGTDADGHRGSHRSRSINSRKCEELDSHASQNTTHSRKIASGSRAMHVQRGSHRTMNINCRKDEEGSETYSRSSHSTCRGGLKSRRMQSHRSRKDEEEIDSDSDASCRGGLGSRSMQSHVSSNSRKHEEESDVESHSGNSTCRGGLNSRIIHSRMSSNIRKDEEENDANSHTSHSMRTSSSRHNPKSSSKGSDSNASPAQEKALKKAKYEVDDTSSHSSDETAVCPNDVATKEDFNESKQQLMDLLEENETLRTNVVKLRSDFETMLHHMNAIEDGNSEIADGDSISSDGNSLALEKIEEEEQKRKATKKSMDREKRLLSYDEADVQMIKEFVMEEKYKDMQSYQECIDGLLGENERLSSKVVALSKEREEILQEVHALQDSCSSSLNHKDDSLPDVVADPVTDGTGQHHLLTNEEMATSHNQTMEEIASLIRGIGTASNEDEERSDALEKEEQKRETDKDVIAMSDEIMQLVSKILAQRVPVAAAIQEDKITLDDEDSCKNSKPADAAEDNIETPLTANKGGSDKHRVSDYHESFSVCTVTSSDTCNGENIHLNKEGEMSSNSLFDGTSPSIVDPEGRFDDDDDNASALEIIYEYETGSEEVSETGSSFTSQRSAYNAYVGRYKDYHRDNGSCCEEIYSSCGEEGEYHYYPDEDVECPPRGYHRYSPSPSRHTSRSSSTASNKNVTNSEENDDPSYRRGKSVHSHCSTYAAASKSGRVSGVEQEESRSGQCNKDIYSNSKKSHIDDHTTAIDNFEDEQEELVKAIESHLTGSPLLGSPPSCGTSLSADVSLSEDMTHPSSSSCGTGSSTRECKGITITVVSRASRHVNFPSSPAHTYVTFFNATLMKSQVDAVLEEQFQETRDILESSVATHQRTTCPTTRSSRASKRKKYQGEYNGVGKRHGYGIYTSKNGNEYRGEWQHDKREGLGVVKIGNGDVFEGQFECNLKNGIGVYHYKDGECDLSQYKNDARIGDSIRYCKDRTQAFRLSDKDSPARISDTISLEEAAEVAKGMGTIVAC